MATIYFLIIFRKKTKNKVLNEVNEKLYKNINIKKSVLLHLIISVNRTKVEFPLPNTINISGERERPQDSIRNYHQRKD